jgi:hypothetical protein
MATVDSKEIVDEIIAGNGHYMDDPRVVKIVRYENMFNRKHAYGLVYETDGDPMRYENAPQCINSEVIWEVK